MKKKKSYNHVSEIYRRSAVVVAAIFVICPRAFASCGSVDYCGHARALYDVWEWLQVLAASVLILLETVGGILLVYSAFRIYIKMQLGEQGVAKDIMMTVSGCLFLIASGIIFPAMFGYAKL